MALKHVSEYMAGAIFGMISDPKNAGLKRETKSCRNTSGSTQSNNEDAQC